LPGDDESTGAAETTTLTGNLRLSTTGLAQPRGGRISGGDMREAGSVVFRLGILLLCSLVCSMDGDMRRILPCSIACLLLVWLVPHSRAACIEYSAAGNIRPDAGTVELWYELPFDVSAIRPDEVWMPGFLFYVRKEQGEVASAKLLLRFQSIPAVKSPEGTVTRARSDGICVSPKGDGMYFTYEQLGVQGNEANHIAVSWDGDRTWGYSNGKQLFEVKPGSGGNYTVPQLFKFNPYESVIRLGLSSSPQLLRIYALRISCLPRTFSPMTAVPRPREEMDTLLLDEFSNIEDDGGTTSTIPNKSSPLVRNGTGTISGLWHTGSSQFGKYIALWPADVKLETLIPSQ